MDDAGIKPKKKDSPLMGALCYVAAFLPYMGLLVPLVIYISQKEDKFARYHALQAISFELALIPVFLLQIFFAILLLITIIGYFMMFGLIILTALASMALNLYLAYNAYQGRSPMLPYIGEFALKQLK